MQRCSSLNAKMIIQNYDEQTNKLKEKIEKNFTDMDLENNDVKGEIKEIINEMKIECDKLSAYMKSQKKKVKG